MPRAGRLMLNWISVPPLPCPIPRERAGVRVLSCNRHYIEARKNPHPIPLPSYLERGQETRMRQGTKLTSVGASSSGVSIRDFERFARPGRANCVFGERAKYVFLGRDMEKKKGRYLSAPAFPGSSCYRGLAAKQCQHLLWR